MLRTEPVTVLCILISIPLVPRSYRPNANYNPTKRYLPSPPDAFTYSKKWPVLIRPSLAGFDSTTDRKVRSSRAISAQIQLVEIAKALSYDAQIVIMEQGQSISELEALDRGYSPAGGTGQ